MKTDEFTTEEIIDMAESIDMSDFWEDSDEYNDFFSDSMNDEELWEDTEADDDYIFDFDSLEDNEDDLPELTMEDVFGCSGITAEGNSNDFFTPFDDSLLTKTDLWNDLLSEVDNSDLLVYVLAATVTVMCGRPFSVRHIIDSVYLDGRNGFDYAEVRDAVLAADNFFSIWCNSHLADFNMRSNSLRTMSCIFKNMPGEL